MTAIEWAGDRVRMLDQRKLPHEEAYLEATQPEEVANAIRSLAIRGAPLLGIAAGFGLALAAIRSEGPTVRDVVRDMESAGEGLIGGRPPAINNAWAVERVLSSARSAFDDPGDGVRAAAVTEALAIAAEDEAACLAIGRLGSG